MSLDEDDVHATLTFGTSGKRESVSLLTKEDARTLYKLAEEMRLKWLGQERNEQFKLARAGAAKVHLHTGPVGVTRKASVNYGSRATGTIKFYDSTRGFGFIIPDGGGQDVHVGSKNLRDVTYLNQGDRVEYRVRAGSKGPWAAEVRRI